MMSRCLFALVLFAAFFGGCRGCGCVPEPDFDSAGGSKVFVENLSYAPTTVHVTFGASSVIKSWTFCAPADGSQTACTFLLKDKKELPTKGAYLNATISFDAPMGCGVTKAEIDANNPKWYSTIDVSLVDGYSNRIAVVVQPHVSGVDAAVLGPPVDEVDGNEWVFGLFPYGCDICVERQNPPCGIAKGKEGCKEGTQYDPDVPCQYQGLVKGGGETITIQLRANP